MRVTRVLLAAFIVILFLGGCAPDKDKENNNVTTAGSTAATTAKPATSGRPPEPSRTETDPSMLTLSKMSTEEKIGQLLVFGFEGAEADVQASGIISKYKPGGLIIMGDNVKSAAQLRQLVNSLKAAASKNRVPAFISVDEEGGRVSRMPPELRNMPSALTVGKTGDSGYAKNMGGVIAEELKAFGFNMDFAPVLDIWSNPKNTVIGDRAFGTDPKTAGAMGVQAMKGLADGGIIPVVKHFPGHGDTVADSHKELPVSNSSPERLKDFEFKPFEAAIANGADAVMIAHILLERVDDKYPSSLSKAVVTGILRNQLGFGGVVITDDMTMGAIADNYGLEEAAVMAVNAGCDLVLVVRDYDKEARVAEALKSAVQKGEISQERLDESVYRILKLKAKYGLTDDPVGAVDVKKLNEDISRFLQR